jgi:hypothetical protein
MIMQIKSVFWGRVDKKTCPSKTWNTSSNCKGKKMSAAAVMKRCHMKRMCYVNPQTRDLGDPCPGVHKYLRIVYVCIPLPTPPTIGPAVKKKTGTFAVRFGNSISHLDYGIDGSKSNIPWCAGSARCICTTFAKHICETFE